MSSRSFRWRSDPTVHDLVSNIKVGDEDARPKDVLGRIYEVFLICAAHRLACDSCHQWIVSGDRFQLLNTKSKITHCVE